MDVGHVFVTIGLILSSWVNIEIVMACVWSVISFIWCQLGVRLWTIMNQYFIVCIDCVHVTINNIG